MLCDGSSPRSWDWFIEHLQNLTEQQEIITTSDFYIIYHIIRLQKLFNMFLFRLLIL